MTKKEFESPLSSYIRYFCSQCPNWIIKCDLASEEGSIRIFACILASMSSNLNRIRKSYEGTES